VRSAHDCAEGGLAIALAEACIGNKLGAEINLGLNSTVLAQNSQRWDEILFGEGGARIVVSIRPEQQQIWESYLTQQLGDDWQKIGQVGSPDTSLRVFTAEQQPLIEVTIELMCDRFFNSIERRLTARG
jgi:phosphoribosylformylglycinamidine synthase